MEQKQLAVLRPGESFGELALISSQPRMASILCRELCVFATLTRDEYSRILARVQSALMQLKIAVLTKQAIFRHLSKSTLQRLSYFFRIRRFKRKQVVFSAGEKSQSLYLVKDGEFQLTQDVDMPVPSSPKHLRLRVDVTLITVGEFIGSEEVIGRRPYRYTCSCHSTTGELLAISDSDFFHEFGNEETLVYFSTLGKVREEYRQKRVQTVKKVEREKRAMLMSLSSIRDMSLNRSHNPSDSSFASFSHTHRSSDLSFSGQLQSQSTLRAMLESTSGKRMTASHKVLRAHHSIHPSKSLKLLQ